MDYPLISPGSYSVYDLKNLTGLTSPDQASEFKLWLKSAAANGQLVTYLSGRRGASQPVQEGTVTAHAKGFGFVAPKGDGRKQGPEIFTSPATMATLLTGDVVQFHVVPGKEGRGELAEVLAARRPASAWLGTLQTCGAHRVLLPDQPAAPQLVVTGVPDTVTDTDVVVAHVAEGTPFSQVVEAHFVRNLGPRGRPGFDTNYAIAAFMLPHEFSDAILEEAESLPEPYLEPGRKDLRAENFVTIDGDTTRDFDDAISVTQANDYFQLKVAIADVSHYVKEGGALDAEAKARGTSVYFPDRVIPMLPERLSNGLCSLIPEAPRFAVVCEMRVGPDGEIEHYEFYNALIESKARLTYGQVSAFADGITIAVPDEQVTHLHTLIRLCGALEQARAKAAALPISNKEAKLFQAPDGALQIKWTGPTAAHRYVELCMLAANHCAARVLKDTGLAGLFRHHKGPAQDDWIAAQEALRERGVHLGDTPSLKEITDTLRKTKSFADAPQIENILLKMLPSATYDAIKPDHFSLDIPYYTHFTSPIRRYPDLIVHRALKAYMASATCDSELMAHLAEHCSERATRAQRASNHVWTKLKRRYVAENQIGGKSAAKVVKSTAKGVKVYLQEWQTMAWLSDSEMTSFKVEEGQLLQVQVVSASDTEIQVKLALED